jgi:hypothetical protein
MVLVFVEERKKVRHHIYIRYLNTECDKEPGCEILVPTVWRRFKHLQRKIKESGGLVGLAPAVCFLGS